MGILRVTLMLHVMIFLDRMNATVSMVSLAMAPIAMVFGPFYFYLHFLLIVFRKLSFLFAIGQNVMCYVLLWRRVLSISSPSFIYCCECEIPPPPPPSSNRHGQATRTFVCKYYSHNLLLNALDECPASILSSSITEVYVSSYQKLIIYEGLHAPIVVEG